MASSPPYAPFLLAQKAKGYHVAVHPADSRLDPPESYLLVQTLLILFTAILWTMAYLFYSIRTFRDHKSAMPLYCLYGNLAWELFYWLVVASTSFERYGCGAWFVADLLLAAVTVRFEYADHMWQATWMMCRGVCIFVLSFWVISVSNPDHQSSGFWTGLLLQGSISWGSLYEIVHGEDMKGHSLEIWCARTVGTVFAFLTFLWRYLNAAENWLYVVNPWALALMTATILGDVLYPIFFLRRTLKKAKLV